MEQKFRRYLKPISVFGLILLLILQTVQAQDTTTPVPSKKKKATEFPTRYTTERMLDHLDSLEYPDTSLQCNEIYHPLYRKLILFQDLGNMITPARSLIFSGLNTPGFRMGSNPFELYFKKPEEATYYNTKLPFAEFEYAQGKNEVFLLNARFAQNISPRSGFGAEYYGPTSKGFYLRQYTNTYHTQLNYYYANKIGTHRLLANATYNYGLADESGGIVSDSAFEALTGSNKSAITYLNNSENRFKNSIYTIKNYVYTGTKKFIYTENDTSVEFTAKSYFAHTIQLHFHSQVFSSLGDTSHTIFPVYLTDTTYGTLNGIKTFQRYDSLHVFQFSNRLQYVVFGGKTYDTRRFLELFAEHRHISVYQKGDAEATHYENLQVGGSLIQLNNANYIPAFQLDGYYFLPGGYNGNDLKMHAEVWYKTPLLQFHLEFANQLYTPDYTLAHFRSASFAWDHSFSKINTIYFKAGIQKFTKHVQINAEYSQQIVSNWVYFGLQNSPEQTSKTVVMHQFHIVAGLAFWKMHLDHHLYVQNTQSDIIRVPTLGGMAHYYFEAPVFRKKLTLQLGSDVFYNTAYYGNAYHPETRAFYLQNDVKIGNYPMINVFANLQLRKAILFITYEHLNQDWSNSGFYYTPHNPLPLKISRMGIRWRIFN